MIELDALRQREFFAVVHGLGGAAHVVFPSVAAGLAAAAGFFLAAEGPADLGARGADVDVGDAAVAARGREEQFGLADFVGEDRRRQALRDVVLQRDRFVEVLVRHDVEDRGEGFLLDHLGVGRDADERGFDVGAALGDARSGRPAAADDRTALGFGPVEGGVQIDGHDLREYTLTSLREQISIVLQDSVLFSASVRDNIAYGALGSKANKVTDAEIEAAARLANAHDFIIQLPDGYDTVLGERGSTLSGGQRQRIAIARAAIRNAPIVILDEPTTGLDSASEATVSEALNRLTRHKTTFWISHNLRIVQQADTMLYIEQGRILERGTHVELMRQGGRYAHLYRLQSEATEQNRPPCLTR